ncbi:MAG: pyridoxamine 5'-phosphate oxidase [Candidatus Omnitrophota bacterium]|nr:pyridoxamine 5'-phosphate oxidase [Candidatus Omnitrophota bacterium]
MKALKKSPLSEAAAGLDPVVLFGKWFRRAEHSGIYKANAMTLATVAAGGRAATRTVLLKSHDSRGFIFFTNYRSQKARELKRSANASLLFHWAILGRQVRIDGRVKKVARAESEAYFATRPRDYQLGAWASDQSSVVRSRKAMDKRMDAVKKKFFGRSVPCPAHWGGYRLAPKRMEFWQERPGRFHDRLRYTKIKTDRWRRERLAP